MSHFHLQFEPDEIPELASRYAYDDDTTALALGAQARERGWYELDAFLSTCEWKSPRIRPRVRRNSAVDVQTATRLALAARDPLDAIGALRSLYGVNWAVASVFLHLAHRDPYPIVDFRALHALGRSPAPHMGSRLWLEYVTFFRGLARSAGVDARTLDRALWQWSKEQGSRPLRTPGTTRVRGKTATRTTTFVRTDSVADVVILGCVSSKLPGVHPAKDLYVSPLWRKRRAFAEGSGRPWVIFSAKHGILGPDDMVETYDVAIAHLPRAQQRVKGEEAAAQLEARFGDLSRKRFEIHAGSAYVDAIAPGIRSRGGTLINRLGGLSIGYQLQWYGQVGTEEAEPS